MCEVSTALPHKDNISLTYLILTQCLRQIILSLLLAYKMGRTHLKGQ